MVPATTRPADASARRATPATSAWSPAPPAHSAGGAWAGNFNSQYTYMIDKAKDCR